MDREYRLKFCQQCTSKQFSPQKGIVCAHTGEHATFDMNCPDYIEDPVAVKQVKRELEAKKEYAAYEESMGMSRFGIKDGLWAGIVMLFLGVLIIVGGVLLFDRLFLYAFVLIVLGIIAIVRGTNRRSQDAIRKARSENAIDCGLDDF